MKKPLINCFPNYPHTNRDLLVRVLREERGEAFHDLLATLTWLIDCNDFALTFEGEPMQYYEGGLHCDFVGRASGDWEWPQD